LVQLVIGVTGRVRIGEVATRESKDGSVNAMTTHGDVAVFDELRFLADSLRRVDAAAAAADWGDDGALTSVVAEARAEVASLQHGVVDDVAAAGASTWWRDRAKSEAIAAGANEMATTPGQAGANAVVAVALARAAVAEAVLAVAQAHRMSADEAKRSAVRRSAVLRVDPLSRLGRRVVDEVRHVFADKPRAILLRLTITVGISLAMVAAYNFVGVRRYDDFGQLTLYLFSAVVGSVVCTNALCFEAERVRESLSRGERMWRILVAKNLAMATLIVVAAIPVIAFLAATTHGNPAAMVDQLVTMVFIWLGLGNVLSVLYPLRHEPISARLRDGTWKPFLILFAVSYGVGLTANLMIYWRLWAKYGAAAKLDAGDWGAFALVLASALTSWILLTVFALAASREPRIRRVLSREMVVYRRD